MRSFVHILGFAILLQRFTAILAAQIIAPSQPPVQQLNVTGDDLPLDPYQFEVPRTSTTMIFRNFKNKGIKIISDSNFLGICAAAQYEIAQSSIRAHADATTTVAQPNFEWRHGTTYIRLNIPNLELTWKQMSEAVHGIAQFGWHVGWLATEFVVLDKEKGIVAQGNVGTGYGGPINGTVEVD
ncbi:hypothetical protein ACLMJK_004896 [Lecanora helva]